MNKIKIYHFHNGLEGGVLSVIKNLLLFSTNNIIENHIIHAINKNLIPKYVVAPIKGAVSQQLFYYSQKNNFYFTCRQLSKLLPDDKAIIVAHDWLELGMASNLGLQNPVVHVVHGNYDYYYGLATGHKVAIDVYACISEKIYQTLITKLFNRKERIYKIHFPVQHITTQVKKDYPLQLVYYVGNLKDDNKQFKIIIKIAEALSTNPGDYFFTIAGGGMNENEFFEIWPEAMKSRVKFIGFQSNEVIINHLKNQHVFLLPSLTEGLPVSLVEAMKAGVVPLISYWNGGVSELVNEGITGYYISIGDANEYAKCIKKLHVNRYILNNISGNCIQRANELFNPLENTIKFEEACLAATENVPVKKAALKIYGSRLDHPIIPNFITTAFRKKK